mmetsp:Transcript_29802/g.41922  ORF Transcript_29802/g.41922 Transcript_29802/m.41922 type:complete len:228 (+) Transcript_29802:78-761(+)
MAAKTPKTKPISAGFLIRSSKSKFLLCHATKSPNGKWTKYDGNWTVPKGIVEEGESKIDAAIRELREETNIDLLHRSFRELLPPNLNDADPFVVFPVGEKKVHLFLLEDEQGRLQDPSIELKCSTKIENMHPSLSYLIGLPEVDGYMWVEREDAEKMVYKSQQKLFAEGFIEKKLKEQKEGPKKDMAEAVEQIQKETKKRMRKNTKATTEPTQGKEPSKNANEATKQ